MMGLTVPAPWGWVVLGLCAIAAVIGLMMVLWPKKREQTPLREPELSADLALDGDVSPHIVGNDFDSDRPVAINLRGTRGAVIDGNIFGPLEKRGPNGSDVNLD